MVYYLCHVVVVERVDNVLALGHVGCAVYARRFEPAAVAQLLQGQDGWW